MFAWKGNGPSHDLPTSDGGKEPGWSQAQLRSQCQTPKTWTWTHQPNQMWDHQIRAGGLKAGRRGGDWVDSSLGLRRARKEISNHPSPFQISRSAIFHDPLYSLALIIHSIKNFSFLSILESVDTWVVPEVSIKQKRKRKKEEEIKTYLE